MGTEWDIAEPRADALVESLRSFGYSPETAIADLIDNSISAGARRIDVGFHWAGKDSTVWISDDGAGMSEAELINAMRPGSTSPLATRGASDLGRFGLGLKTASFSQARELTVVSRQGGERPSTRRWDLDVIARSGEWRLLRDLPPGTNSPDIPDSAGTVVIWSKCDRLVGESAADDQAAQTRFANLAAKVSQHLGAIFHRFMTGRGKVSILLNGQSVDPWDPFMEAHPATQRLSTEELHLNGHLVTVAPFVLPHRSKLDPSGQEQGRGLTGWNDHQGFYLYRGGRLLVMGSWLGIGVGKDEHSKLARIRVDFPAELDLAWQVDVKKSSARAPGPLQADLKRVALATRRRAEEIYRHRGKVLTRGKSQDFVLAWHQTKTRDGETKYRVNRAHPVIDSLLSSSTDRPAVERALRFIEETIPTTMIGVSIASALDTQPVPFGTNSKEVLALLAFMHAELLSDGKTSDEALARLAASEPFIHHPHVVAAFKESL